MAPLEFIYGRHAVWHTLNNPRRRVHKVVFQADLPSAGILQRIEAFAHQAGRAVERLDRVPLERKFSLSGKAHQGVVAIGDPYPYAELAEVLSRQMDDPPYFVILDHIQDPHNLGALIRSAELAGAHAIVLPLDRACQITPTVVKTSAGACELLPIVQVVNLNQTITILQQHGLQVVGLETGPEHHILYDLDYTGSTALVIGAEGPGMATLTRKRCDALVEIPMAGQLESLNASVAGGIAMFEILRQRRIAKAHD